MNGKDERVGGARWDRLRTEALQRYQDKREVVFAALMVDGFPPFTVKVSPREQYDQLIAMEQSGDPAYWSDPAAQAALAKLAQRYGPPSPLVQEPYGGPLPNNPGVQTRLTQASDKLGMPASLVGGP